MKKNKNIIVVLILLICSMLCCLTPTNNIVFANSNVDKYTNVLDDLKIDTNFNEYNYPQTLNDYSLKVMQIAESNQNELFVYVYQPSGTIKNLIATSINIATTFGQNLSFVNYKLTFLNAIGVFYKYKVNDFVVNSATTREYEITSIYREFDETIDEALADDNENTIDEVNYKVAKHWTFTADGITCSDIETITITDKYVGFVRYLSNGVPIYIQDTSFDSHFVAFSTDKQIDKLMEADIYYTTQTYNRDVNLGFIENVNFSYCVDCYAYLNYSQVAVVETEIINGVAIGGNKYSWDRIQSVNDFISTEDRTKIYNGILFNSAVETQITDEGLEDLQGKDWVLRFVETEYNRVVNGVGLLSPYHETSTKIGNVSILRLKFETNGTIFNLGVVDNKQTGDGIPDNYTFRTLQITDFFKSLLGILLLILLIVLLAPFLPQMLSFLWWLIKGIFNVVVYIVSIPFGWFEKKNNKKGANSEKNKSKKKSKK